LDKVSKEKRSEIMSKIRSSNTKIELEVFKRLKKRGIYFQKHYKKAPGTPDIALPRKKKAVFIDGDFWHGNNFETLRNKISGEYWINKIEKNISRDIKINAILKENGWSILRVWETDINNQIDCTIDKIYKFLMS